MGLIDLDNIDYIIENAIKRFEIVLAKLLVKIDDTTYKVKKFNYIIKVNKENKNTPFSVTKNDETKDMDVHEFDKLMYLINKTLKVAKTTHTIDIYDGNIKKGTDYFYETKNYWVTWWGKKYFKTTGFDNMNWSRERIDLNSIQKR